MSSDQQRRDGDEGGRGRKGEGRKGREASEEEWRSAIKANEWHEKMHGPADRVCVA